MADITLNKPAASGLGLGLGIAGSVDLSGVEIGNPGHAAERGLSCCGAKQAAITLPIALRVKPLIT